MARRIGLVAALCFFNLIPAEARRHRRPPKQVHVRSISVVVKNVFDTTNPSEDIWPFRTANTIHIRTRPSVVLRQLLMKPGDVVTEDMIAESERNLRSLSFIKDATITQTPVSDGVVDLVVETQDTWTLQPQANFGSAGGQSHFSAGVLEENILGYGKTLSYFYSKDKYSNNNSFTYMDPQIGSTRLTLSTMLVNSITDKEEHFNLQQPFYSLEAPVAAGLAFDRSDILQRVFQNGDQTSEYNQVVTNIDPFVGTRLNADPLNVQRLQMDFHYQENFYKPDGSTLAGTLPHHLEQSGPKLTYSLVQSRFIKQHFADRAGRTEDFNLGHQITAVGGYYSRVLGSSEDSIPLAFSDAFGFGGDGDDNRWFGLALYGVAGRYNIYASDQRQGTLLNTLYYANLNLYRHWTDEIPTTGVIHFESAYLANPDSNNVLQLGGDTGLRGYKVASFTGNKSLLINMENRIYDPHEFLHLAYVGAAMFADIGQVQPQNLGFSMGDFHADVGLGMRFALTRSSAGTIFRVDLAYAVGPVPGQKRFILSVSSGVGFNRSGNTYSKFPGVPSL